MGKHEGIDFVGLSVERPLVASKAGSARDESNNQEEKEVFH